MRSSGSDITFPGWNWDWTKSLPGMVRGTTVGRCAWIPSVSTQEGNTSFSRISFSTVCFMTTYFYHFESCLDWIDQVHTLLSAHRWHWLHLDWRTKVQFQRLRTKGPPASYYQWVVLGIDQHENSQQEKVQILRLVTYWRVSSTTSHNRSFHVSNSSSFFKVTIVISDWGNPNLTTEKWANLALMRLVLLFWMIFTG